MGKTSPRPLGEFPIGSHKVSIPGLFGGTSVARSRWRVSISTEEAEKQAKAGVLFFLVSGRFAPYPLAVWIRFFHLFEKKFAIFFSRLKGKLSLQEI